MSADVSDVSRLEFRNDVSVAVMLESVGAMVMSVRLVPALATPETGDWTLNKLYWRQGRCYLIQLQATDSGTSDEFKIVVSCQHS